MREVHYARSPVQRTAIMTVRVKLAIRQARTAPAQMKFVKAIILERQPSKLREGEAGRKTSTSIGNMKYFLYLH